MMERGILKNVLSRQIQAKTAMQHLALAATSMSLGLDPTPPMKSQQAVATSSTDGSIAPMVSVAKKPRYLASRSVSRAHLVELTVATQHYNEEGVIFMDSGSVKLSHPIVNVRLCLPMRMRAYLLFVCMRTRTHLWAYVCICLYVLVVVLVSSCALVCLCGRVSLCVWVGVLLCVLPVCSRVRVRVLARAVVRRPASVKCLHMSAHE